MSRRTFGDDLINSQACPYNTVAEFFENNSDVKAYTSMAEKPAPNRMTNKFDIRAVVRTTGTEVRFADIEMREVEHTFPSSAQLCPFLCVPSISRCRWNEAKLKWTY